YASLPIAAFVKLRRFFRDGRRIPGIYDLALSGDPREGRLRTLRPGSREQTTQDLVGRLRLRVGIGDIRLLVDDGAWYIGHVQGRADAFRRDILLTPAGATLRLVEHVDDEGERYLDVAPFDAFGRPVPWNVVRPTGTPPDLPTAFEQVDGRIRPST